MKRCPRCSQEFEDRRIFCPTDGATLRTVEGIDPLVGRVLDGKYAIEESLGRGGMGAVYRARHLLIGDEVAIKILRPEMAKDEDAVERLRREAQAARHLRNPHTINVIDFSATEDGLVFLVMEFVRGRSLREVLRDERRLDLRRVAAIVVQIADGLDHAHRQGIVHRDLKPDNVMLEPAEPDREVVRVLDFGIAKLSDTDTKLRTLTSDDTILGTPCYLSPEQCGTGEVGPRSDVYSLGIMLYEMVTGDVPFDGRSAIEVARQHLFAQPEPPRARNTSLSSQAEAVILRALAKEPEDRYGSAGELAGAFEEAVSRLGDGEIAHTVEIDGRSALAKAETGRVEQRDTAPDRVPARETVADTRAEVPRTAYGLAGTLAGRPRRGWLWVVVALGLVAAAAAWPVARMLRGSEVAREPFAGMVRVPAGPFRMGSDTTRVDCQDEHPPHTVDLPEFYIDRTEVTNAQFRAFCDATGREYPPNPGWDADYFLGKPEYPVINVTWKDAGDFAKWAGKRLPTEAEWEKAARGADGLRYPWGNELRAGVTTVAGMADGYENSAPVGSFPDGASPYGCLDMVGNVFEWTEDWYAAYPGSDGSWDQRGDTGFKKRVVRGGSFTARPEIVDASGGVARASERFCEMPDYRTVNLGFRCAKTP